MNQAPKAKLSGLLRGRRPHPVFTTFAGLAALAFPSLSSWAQEVAPPCLSLRYSFQPDCFRAPGTEKCVSTVDHLDLKPQIAVWLEKADKTRFQNLMVTNLVAARGIGNRPGIWNFLSAPKFPYGKRQNALPIWAHARGVLYETVVMQETDREDGLGWHELHSSPEPFFCKPLPASSISSDPTTEVDVDAITCPSKDFNSAKGLLDPGRPKVYYPPRNDLIKFSSLDCDVIGGIYPACNVSAARYQTLNDLDAVATATPPYGKVFSGRWRLPASLPPGDYVVWLEINKEFDNNSSHRHESFVDFQLAVYGLRNNFGQPSVLYRVPITLDGNPSAAVATKYYGYSGDWTGATDVIAPADATISETPGSGAGRLRDIPGPAGVGRFHVVVEACSAFQILCEPPPPPPEPVTRLTVVAQTSSTAELTFQQTATAAGEKVAGYNIRYRAAESMTAAEFAEANRAPGVTPDARGTPATVLLEDLKPVTKYVVGVQAEGMCGELSEIAFFNFETKVHRFTQLSGCFIATAAYGSAMEPQVDAMRRLRDGLSGRSALFSAAADLYYRSGPAAAEVLKSSDTARAVVRQVLAPVSVVAGAAADLERARRQAAR